MLVKTSQLKTTAFASFGLSTIIMLGLAFSTSTVGAAIVADIAGDWVSAAAEPAGWEYLESTAAIGGAEVPLTPSTPVGAVGAVGFGGGANTFELGAIIGDNSDGALYEIFGDGQSANHDAVVGTHLVVHPSGAGIAPAGEPFVIARYTISAADASNGTSAQLIGSFESLIGGGVTVAVLQNDTTLFTFTGLPDDGLTVAGGSSTGDFNLSTPVTVGDTFSFMVGSGANIFGDETSIRASINVVPEPGTWGLACVALFGTAMLYWRRRRKTALANV